MVCKELRHKKICLACDFFFFKSQHCKFDEATICDTGSKGISLFKNKIELNRSCFLNVCVGNPHLMHLAFLFWTIKIIFSSSNWSKFSLSISTALKPTQHDLNWSNKFFNKKVLETRSHRNQNVIHFKFIQQQFAAGCKCAEVNRRMWFKCRCQTKPLM